MTIAADDRGFTLGHGLFETLLVEGGAIRFWDAHLQRLVRGCAVLGMPAPDSAHCREAAEGALAGAPPRAALRLTWSAGPGGRGLDAPAEPRPQLTASIAPAPLPSGPARLATARTRRNEHSPASRLKTLSYLDNVLARAEARAAGADEALMLNTAGEVACAAAANLFWLEGATLCTPALECGVLDGIIRAELLRAARGLGLAVDEVRAAPGRLSGRPMLLANSLVGLRRIAALDGVPVPEWPGVNRLSEAISQG